MIFVITVLGILAILYLVTLNGYLNVKARYRQEKERRLNAEQQNETSRYSLAVGKSKELERASVAILLDPENDIKVLLRGEEPEGVLESIEFYWSSEEPSYFLKINRLVCDKLYASNRPYEVREGSYKKETDIYGDETLGKGEINEF